MYTTVRSMAFDINKHIHPGYGEPFSRFSFFNLEGKHLTSFGLDGGPCEGYLIFEVWQDCDYVVYRVCHDPEFGFYYRYVSGKVWF